MPQRFAGHIDSIEPVLAGWVVDRQQPATPVRFLATIDRSLRLPIVADLSRPDVAAAGFGGPNCGFSVRLPAGLLDGGAHSIVLLSSDGAVLALEGYLNPVVLGPVSAAVAPMSAADRDDVVGLLQQTYRESGIEPDEITRQYAAHWIGFAVGAEGGLLIGARVAGRLVGYALLERGGAARIGAVALSVLRAYRRKGIGERLMRALLEGARGAGKIDEVWLSVGQPNLPARRLYEKLGFVYCATAPSSLVVPASFLVMSWRVDRFDETRKPGGC